LPDFELLADRGKDNRLANIEQGVAHAFQIAQDEVAGDEIFGFATGAEFVENPVELDLVVPVQGEFGAADAEGERHVLFGQGRVDDLERLKHFLEKAFEPIPTDEFRILQVLGLHYDIDGIIGDALEIGRHGDGRAQHIQRPLVAGLAAVDGGIALVFDDAFKVVDVVVAPLHGLDELFVAPFENLLRVLHLPGHFEDHEAEIFRDAVVGEDAVHGLPARDAQRIVRSLGFTVLSPGESQGQLAAVGPGLGLDVEFD